MLWESEGKTEETAQEPESRSEEELHKMMKEKLAECQAAVQTGQLLLGSLKKEFPSTMVFFTVSEEETAHADFFWCGDSRQKIRS